MPDSEFILASLPSGGENSEPLWQWCRVENKVKISTKKPDWSTSVPRLTWAYTKKLKKRSMPYMKDPAKVPVCQARVPWNLLPKLWFNTSLKVVVFVSFFCNIFSLPLCVPVQLIVWWHKHLGTPEDALQAPVLAHDSIHMSLYEAKWEARCKPWHSSKKVLVSLRGTLKPSWP